MSMNVVTFLKDRIQVVQELLVSKREELLGKKKKKKNIARFIDSDHYQSLRRELELLQLLFAQHQQPNPKSCCYLSDGDPLVPLDQFFPFSPDELDDLWETANYSDDMDRVFEAWHFAGQRYQQELGNVASLLQFAFKVSPIYLALEKRHELLSAEDTLREDEFYAKWEAEIEKLAWQEDLRQQSRQSYFEDWKEEVPLRYYDVPGWNLPNY